jgi:DNA-binding response OmpR family regulator
MYSTSPTTATPEQEVRHFADERISFDPETSLVTVDGQLLSSLTPTQTKIVDVLSSQPDVYIPHDELFEQVYQKPDYFSSNSLRAHISNLRSTLPEDLRDSNSGAFRSRNKIGYCAVSTLVDDTQNILKDSRVISLAEGRVVFLPENLILAVDGEIKQLRPQQSLVLKKLASNPDKILTRKEIETQIPASDHVNVRNNDYVAAVVSELRRLLGPELGSKTTGIIKTEYRKGYRVVTNLK